MNSQKTQIRCHRLPWFQDTIEIRIWNVRPAARRDIVSRAEPVVFKELPEDEQHLEQPAAMRITPGDAQQFMDELWNCGIRPTHGAGSVGQLAATERHLEDMRALAFKTPKPEPRRS
jgi:hypothetical protein